MAKILLDKHRAEAQKRINDSGPAILMINSYLSGAYIAWCLLYYISEYLKIEFQHPLPGGVFLVIIFVVNFGTIFEHSRAITSAISLDIAEFRSSGEEG